MVQVTEIRPVQSGQNQKVRIGALDPLAGSLGIPNPLTQTLTVDATPIVIDDTAITITIPTTYYIPKFSLITFDDADGSGNPYSVVTSAAINRGSTTIPIEAAKSGIVAGATATVHNLPLIEGLDNVTPDDPITSVEHSAYNAGGITSSAPTFITPSMSVSGARYFNNPDGYKIEFLATEAVNGLQVVILLEDPPESGFVFGRGSILFGYLEGLSGDNPATGVRSYTTTLKGISKRQVLGPDEIEAILTP